MRIYLASRYSRRLEMLEIAEQLRRLGHTVTSSWITGKHETRPGIDANGTEEERRTWAEEDIKDLNYSEALVAFTEEPNAEGRGRGGRHVEYGFALALDLLLTVVGPRENVFHCLPSVCHWPTVAAYRANLDAAIASKEALR